MVLIHRTTTAIADVDQFAAPNYRSHLIPERATTWKGMTVERLRLIPSEATYTSEQIIVAIVTGQPFQLNWQIEGERKQFNQWMNPGDCHILPANLTFQTNCFGNSHLFLMTLEPTILERVIQDTTDQNSTELYHYLGTSDAIVQQFGQLIQAESNTKGLGGQIYVESLAQALVVHLLRNYGTLKHFSNYLRGGLPQYKLQQVVDYIHHHLDQDLTLADLAQVAQISPTYFAGLFKESTGISPHQFVIQRRIERAQQLLRQGKLTISEIALQVGFAHQSHLNYHFKRLVGVTPKMLLQKSP